MVFESKQFLRGKISSLEEKLIKSRQETIAAQNDSYYEKEFLNLANEKLKALEEVNRKLYYKLKCYQAAEKASKEVSESIYMNITLNEASIRRVFADDFKEKYRKPKESYAQKLLGELRAARYCKGTIPEVCGKQLDRPESVMLCYFLENNLKAEFEQVEAFIKGLKHGIEYGKSKGGRHKWDF